MIDGQLFGVSTYCGKASSARCRLRCSNLKCKICYPCVVCMGFGAWREVYHFKWQSSPSIVPAKCHGCGKKAVGLQLN